MTHYYEMQQLFNKMKLPYSLEPIITDGQPKGAVLQGPMIAIGGGHGDSVGYFFFDRDGRFVGHGLFKEHID